MDFTSRQSLVWGEEKLRALKQAHVVIAGVGGLGCVVAEQLARSGIGELTLIDDGRVDAPDLGRQVLYSTENLGEKKVLAATARLMAISPSLVIHRMDKRIVPEADWFGSINARAFADCLDNYAARFAFEDLLPQRACLVHGAVESDRGQVTTVIAGEELSLKRIFYGAPCPPSPIPVIPQICSVVGAVQSLTILKNIWLEAGLLSSTDDALRGVMALFDLSSCTVETLRLS